MKLHLLPTIMSRVDVDIKLNHFYLMGSISTRRSNSQFSNFFETSACTYYHDEKTISQLHPSYQSVLAEFPRLLSMYIVFSGRASFNWAVDGPGLVLFLTGPAHDSNGAQRSSRYLLASGPPALVIFVLQHLQAVFLLNQTHSLVLFSS